MLVNKIVAGIRKDPNNSKGSDLATTVNNLVDISNKKIFTDKDFEKEDHEVNISLREEGSMFADATSGKPVWFINGKWVYSDGTTAYTVTSFKRYAPRMLSYIAASIPDTTLTVGDSLSFWVTGMENSSIIHYIVGSSGQGRLFIRPSDGRTRIYDDQNRLVTYSAGTLYQDGLPHFVDIKFNSGNMEISIDGILKSTQGTPLDATYTFNCLGARNTSGTEESGIAVLYGVSFSNEHYWKMQNASSTIFDTVDSIGTMDLVYIGAPATITDQDTVEVPTLDIPIGENPLTAENVIFTGSSLIQRAMDTQARIDRIEEVATHLGYQGSIINVGVGGNTIKGNLDHWVNSVRGQTYANKDSVAVLVTNGNDISLNRPYVTDTFANTGLSSELATEWTDRFNAAQEDVALVIPTSTTFRPYKSVPIVNVLDLAGTEEDGSLPYNREIFVPLIASLAPEFMKEGVPLLDGYKFILDRYWAVADDQVHMLESVQHCFAENILLELKRFYDNSVANVSGKTVIVYPQNEADSLTNVVGYTPNILLNAKVVDTTDTPIPHLAVDYTGGTVTGQTGDIFNGPSRVADTDFHDDILLSNLMFATSPDKVSDVRMGYARATLSGLREGTTGTLTMAVCRAAPSTGSSREGDYILNGVSIGKCDAGNDAVSNQLGPFGFTVGSDGKVVLETIPTGTLSAFSYIGPIKYVFD